MKHTTLFSIVALATATCLADPGSMYGFSRNQFSVGVGGSYMSDTYKIIADVGGTDLEINLGEHNIAPTLSIGYQASMQGFTLGATGHYTKHSSDFNAFEYGTDSLNIKLDKEMSGDLLVGKKFKSATIFLGYRWTKSTMDFTAHFNGSDENVSHSFKGHGPVIGLSANLMRNFNAKISIADIDQGEKLTWDDVNHNGNLEFNSIETMATLEYTM